MVTWEMLTDVEREDLQFLVENGGGVVYKPRQIRLAELGLITGDDLFSIPTDAGRALVPTASGNGGAGDDLAYHIKCAVVAALSEDKWRNDWTSEEAVNQLTFEIAALRQQVVSLRAALKPFADAFKALPEGLGSTLRVWDGEGGQIHTKATTDHLETAYNLLHAETEADNGS